MPEQLTLVDIERKLRQLYNDLALAQRTLAEARDAEVNAKHAWESKRRRFLLDPDCPRTGRAAGAVTVAERDAWVDVKIEQEQQAYDIAEARRKAAEDHLRTLRDQAVLVSALAKSVQISMGLAGRAEPEWGH